MRPPGRSTRPPARASSTPTRLPTASPRSPRRPKPSEVRTTDSFESAPRWGRFRRSGEIIAHHAQDHRAHRGGAPRAAALRAPRRRRRPDPAPWRVHRRRGRHRGGHLALGGLRVLQQRRRPHRRRPGRRAGRLGRRARRGHRRAGRSGGSGRCVGDRRARLRRRGSPCARARGGQHRPAAHPPSRGAGPPPRSRPSAAHGTRRSRRRRPRASWPPSSGASSTSPSRASSPETARARPTTRHRPCSSSSTAGSTTAAEVGRYFTSRKTCVVTIGV